jgi:hypothetical protein
MVVLSFWAKQEQLVRIQRVVKRHGLRFHNNPAAYLAHGDGSALVQISYEGDDPEPWNQAMGEIDAIRQPPRQDPPKGRWRRLVGWLRGQRGLP